MAQVKSYDSNLVSGSSSISGQPAQGQRRRHNFGDRMYKLSPEETPFFAYLSAVGKAPTDDPVFRVLEDRAPTKWADRSFATNTVSAGILVVGAANVMWTYDVDGAGEVAAVENIPITGGSDIVAGMLVQVVQWGTTGIPYQLTARVESVASDGSTASFRTIEADSNIATLAAGADVNLQVIGTAFGEGSASPDSFGYDMDDTFGYTQIFKTSAYMSNTARATALRGYASEWDRIWSLKLREHKVDIERAMLYNNKGSVNSVQYTDGIIGKIIEAGGWEHDISAALSYSANAPFVRIVEADGIEAVYDQWLEDFEVIFAPERGGASEKFCMASMAVVTYFNRLKSGFLDGSVTDSVSYNLDFSSLDGGLGHKVMKIDTVHGSLSIVKNPLLKGIGKSMMVGVDLGNVSYRPLVGNGLNRDTYIESNVQSPDEDSRKDQILTEAGLEICLPESHFLYQFVKADGTTPIG